MQMSGLLSVGHSNHAIDFFLRLLTSQRVTAVADVRSRPFSRRLPQYDRSELEAALRTREIDYIFLGALLGGRPERRSLYDDEGRVDYEKVCATDEFADGIDELIRWSRKGTVAFLCSEEDPLDCHRGLMITPALVERGVFPGHLRKDGNVQTTAEMEQELLERTGVAEGMHDGLFAGSISAEERRQDLAEAYRRMARRKAFRLTAAEPGASATGGTDKNAL
jgi:uncharacterized protein (DUF488 family)